MPSKKKKYNSRFPPARIKKIMQTDEEIGKVAAAVPVLISKCVELFLVSILENAGSVTNARKAKTMTTSHLKECIMKEKNYDFMRQLVVDEPDCEVEQQTTTTQQQQQTTTQQTTQRKRAASSSTVKQQTTTKRIKSEIPRRSSIQSTATTSDNHIQQHQFSPGSSSGGCMTSSGDCMTSSGDCMTSSGDCTKSSLHNRKLPSYEEANRLLQEQQQQLLQEQQQQLLQEQQQQLLQEQQQQQQGNLSSVESLNQPVDLTTIKRVDPIMTSQPPDVHIIIPATPQPHHRKIDDDEDDDYDV